MLNFYHYKIIIWLVESDCYYLTHEKRCYRTLIKLARISNYNIICYFSSSEKSIVTETNW